MITEDYCSYEVAKLLKEKGFDEPCLQMWECGPDKKYLFRLQSSCYQNITEEDSCLAPTHQMTMKWLREVHSLHINLDIHWLHFANLNGWVYLIEKILDNGVEYIDSKGDENDKTFYSTYKEACEAAIKYCLENLI